MDIEIKSKRLARLETDKDFNDGRPPTIVRAFRKVINLIRQAENSRDLYAFKSLQIEKLKGKEEGFRSMRLNDQYRLVVEFGTKKGVEVVTVIRIEDYH